MKKSITAAVIFLLLVTWVNAKFHPEIQWQEIAAGDFILVFPLGYELQAGQALQAAREIFPELQDLFGPGPRGKIRILLSDSNDNANGSATFFPYNQVEVFLFLPSPDQALSSYRDWLKLVLTHELTHLFTMNAGSGFTNVMRKLMGSNPILYPSSYYSPIWLQEGASIYAESHLNPGGRLNTPDYSIMLGNSVKYGNFPKSQSLYGPPTPWPGPGSWYLFGAGFVNFLEKEYGAGKVKELFRDLGYHLLPRTISSRFKKIFAKDLDRLWQEFYQSHKITPKESYRFQVLSHTGFDQKYPLFTPGGKIVYFNRNYKEYPSIRELDPASGQSTNLVKQTGVTALTAGVQDDRIYYSALDYHKKFYYYSDLYELNLKNRKAKRLTKGKRLSYPQVLGQNILAVQRKAGRSYLVLFHPSTGEITQLSQGFQSLSHLSLSPGGTLIAASLKQAGRNWDIALFDLQGRLQEMITGQGGKNFCPRWLDQETLFYITQKEKEYKLASYTLESRKSALVGKMELPDLNHIEINSRTGQLLFSYYDAKGFNLGLVSLDDLSRKSFEPVFVPWESQTKRTSIQQGKNYSWLRDLLPHYFTPNLREGGDEYQLGAYLSGSDVTGEHAFDLEAYWGKNTGRAGGGFSYTYNGLVPTLKLSAGDYSDFFDRSGISDVIRRKRTLKLSALYPLDISQKKQSYFYADIHAERIDHQIQDQTESLTLNGVKFGFLHYWAKNYWDAFSLSDGGSLALSYSREMPSVGSDYAIQSVGLEYRQYLSLLRPNVLALRMAAVESWGDAWLLYPMGGNTSRPPLSLDHGNLLRMMRGFSSGFFMGRGGLLVNLEYRISLLKVERVFTVVQSIDRIYLAFFIDAGNTWFETRVFDPALSMGVELNALVHVGGQSFNLSGGWALGRNPNHTGRFYFRLGRSF